MHKTVLIVDDSEINRRILRQILASTYDILEASNGEEALTVFRENRKSILAIMLDLMMPVMDGYAFLRAFSKDKDAEHVPVIVSTGQTDKENEIEALRLGAWDFIIKPYVPEIIHFRLNNVIVRSQLTAFQELKYKAEYDVLTGIFNQDKFFSLTRKMLLANPDTHFSLIRFDVDRFHLINAYFGVAYGDRLLKHIGKTMRENSEGHFDRTTYGRINADVFAMCIPTDDKAVIFSFLVWYDKLLRSFDSPFDIVFSYGICQIKDHNMPVDEIYDHASLAAKSCKGNYVKNYAYFEESMEQRVELEQEIINDMNTALQEEQFVVWYQPKYDIRLDAPVGAEALVRWNHPKKGMISPALFIPIFEHNGFIMRLDAYVWEHVCRDMRKWMDDGRKVHPILVNISRVDLANPRLVETIVELADRYQIPYAMLQLELTESAYTDNPEKMIQMMDAFREKGFVILMDDFGSGYSSLGILKDIEVNVLKIDMRFFSKTAVEGRSKSIIASVLRMAKWLRIPVIAEGVETRENVEFLRGIGCEYVQGYFYAKPMPAEQYLQYMDMHQKEMKYQDVAEMDTEQLWNRTLAAENQKGAAAVMEYESGKFEMIHVNNLFYDLFGYTDMEEEFRDPLQFIAPEYRAGFEEAFLSALASQGMAAYDFKRNASTNHPMWISIRIKYVGRLGHRSVFYCEFLDVTENRMRDSEISAYLKAVQIRESGKMLIVDDVEMSRVILREMFESEYEILEAKNGAEALELLNREGGDVDAILLDMCSLTRKTKKTDTQNEKTLLNTTFKSVFCYL